MAFAQLTYRESLRDIEVKPVCSDHEALLRAPAKKQPFHQAWTLVPDPSIDQIASKLAIRVRLATCPSGLKMPASSTALIQRWRSWGVTLLGQPICKHKLLAHHRHTRQIVARSPRSYSIGSAVSCTNLRNARPPNLSLPALDRCWGTRPSQAANCRARLELGLPRSQL
jgi:hypothetical protein